MLPQEALVIKQDYIRMVLDKKIDTYLLEDDQYPSSGNTSSSDVTPSQGEDIEIKPSKDIGDLPDLPLSRVITCPNCGEIIIVYMVKIGNRWRLPVSYICPVCGYDIFSSLYFYTDYYIGYASNVLVDESNKYYLKITKNPEDDPYIDSSVGKEITARVQFPVISPIDTSLKTYINYRGADSASASSRIYSFNNIDTNFVSSLSDYYNIYTDPENDEPTKLSVLFKNILRDSASFELVVTDKQTGKEYIFNINPSIIDASSTI